MYKRRFNPLLATAAMAILGSLMAHGQTNSPAQDKTMPTSYPGQTINFEIGFVGKEANKIIQIQPFIRLTSPLRKDQEPFIRVLHPDRGTLDRHQDGSFKVSILVPKHAATGDYIVTLTAILEGGGSIDYTADMIGAPTYRITNDETFERPKVTFKPLPSAP